MPEQASTISFGSAPIASAASASVAPATLAFGSKPIAPPVAAPLVGGYIGSVLSKLGAVASDTKTNFGNTIDETNQNFDIAAQDFNKGNEGTGIGQYLATVGRTPVKILSNTAGVIGGALNALVPDWLTQLVNNGSKALQNIGTQIHDAHPELAVAFNKMANDSDMNHAIQTLSDLATQNPDLKDAVGQGINTILLGVGAEGGAKAGAAEGDTTAGEAAGTSKTAKPTPKAPSDGASMGAFTPADDATAQELSADWKKPASINKPSYNNARAVIEKDPGVTDFIGQQGLDPAAHVEDGVYNTESSAQTLRDTAGAVTAERLRPALHEADYSYAPKPVSELKPTVDTTGHLITADETEALDEIVQKKLDALDRKYPDGMTLVNQLDEKITYDKNGGYKEYKSNADNNNAIANRAIADSLRANLTKDVPEEIGYDDVQAYSSKFYRAADYLDALNGKKAPVSLLQRGIRYGAGIIGAKVGGMIGGDIVSDFVGYHIGRLLEQTIENLKGSALDDFVTRLRMTNPPAYAKLTEYLGKAKMKALDMSQRMLPAGKPLGSDGNPIITPAPTTFEKAADSSKQTSVNKVTGDIYTRDLKTGKITITPGKKE